jgi:hypothetical protein
MLRKSMSCVLVAAIGFLPVVSQARMISTDQAIASARGTSASAEMQAKVQSFLTRDDVAQKLNGMGVSSATAKERVNSMSPEELELLSGRIDSLPAGGALTTTGGIIIAVTLIIIVALVAYAPNKK